MNLILSLLSLKRLAPYFEILAKANPKMDFSKMISALFDEFSNHLVTAVITQSEILSLFSRFEIVLKTDQASAIVFLRAILRIAFAGYTRIRLDIFDAPNVNKGTVFKKRIDQNSNGRHTIVVDGKRHPNHSKYTEYRYSIDAEKHNLSYSYLLVVNCKEREGKL
jgi:hypothetical protein